MKKLLYISILAASTYMQAHIFTFYNETRDLVYAQIDQRGLASYINPGDSFSFNPSGSPCLYYFKVTSYDQSVRKSTDQSSREIDTIDHHVNICEDKDFHIVYDNPNDARKALHYQEGSTAYIQAKKLRVDWNPNPGQKELRVVNQKALSK